MLNTVERLREKPEAHRKRVAFMVSVIITGIIFIVWLSVIGTKFGQSAGVVKEQDGASLVAGVKSGFSEVFEEGREKFDESRRELESIFQ